MTKKELYLKACMLAVGRYIDDGCYKFGMKKDGNLFTTKWEDVMDWLIDQYANGTPQPKAGRWIKICPADIYECSVCGQDVMTPDICAYKYCHQCGAKMQEDKE